MSVHQVVTELTHRTSVPACRSSTHSAAGCIGARTIISTAPGGWRGHSLSICRRTTPVRKYDEHRPRRWPPQAAKAKRPTISRIVFAGLPPTIGRQARGRQARDPAITDNIRNQSGILPCGSCDGCVSGDICRAARRATGCPKILHTVRTRGPIRPELLHDKRDQMTVLQ